MRILERGLRKTTLLILLIAAGLFGSGGELSAALTAKANHDPININFFYHGSTVRVGGVSSPDTDLVIKITSPEGDRQLRKKGKVGGLLWMNVATLNLDNVPELYFLRSTRKLDEILSPEESAKNLLGYTAMERHVSMEPVPDEQEKVKWFNEFVKLQESSNLYSVTEGEITLTQKGGQQTYHTVFQWPYQAMPGQYTVEVYEVKDGKIIGTAQSDVQVEQVGIVKSLKNMAVNHGGYYGGLAVIAALSVGFGVGMIFKVGEGAH